MEFLLVGRIWTMIIMILEQENNNNDNFEFIGLVPQRSIQHCISKRNTIKIKNAYLSFAYGHLTFFWNCMGKCIIHTDFDTCNWKFFSAKEDWLSTWHPTFLECQVVWLPTFICWIWPTIWVQVSKVLLRIRSRQILEAYLSCRWCSGKFPRLDGEIETS